VPASAPRPLVDPRTDDCPERLAAARAAAVVYAALAAVDIRLAAARSPEVRRWRRLTKPLLMPVLGTAFSASLAGRGLHHGGLLRGGTVAAQALSGVGDIALLSSRASGFVTGLGAFLGAHGAYGAAFLSATGPRSPTDVLTRRSTWLAAGAFGALAPLAASAAGRRRPGLRAPVVAYSAALIAMVGSSTTLDARLPARARRRTTNGALLFLASDSLLAVREFVLDDSGPWVDALVMASYTSGQALIAAGVSEAVRHRTQVEPHRESERPAKSTAHRSGTAST
jgi:uncharacterized membrane protein YhhN